MYLYLIINKELNLKVIIQKDNSQLKVVNQQLSQVDLELTQDIEITLNDGLNYIDISQQNQEAFCDNNLCQEYYKIHKNINKIQKQKGIKINFTSTFYIQCYYHLQDLFLAEEEINSHIIFSVKSYSKNLTLSKILMARMFKGFIFNNTNSIIMSLLSEPEQIPLNEFQSYVLSLKALEKCFKDYSKNYIPQIIYDLQDI
ncbi:hypothetical protein TTHERM_00361680 (macronuclear) [Tetrahymena thermophila SB210]|uniref:Uncharacterized protein n=1 Tax=Tetrahymena thermophila (strain SB210) TaxID=312017 RepID=Q22PH6_TETTS|nr:hypothetical protein TTHERM_00361680 [Tetrahymena thermophila SB210]EAR87133.2 hypothetical protein TTHERM_00361680 [Tetrahymena thermophila SB210]|eukprot:XP_001007378.2 hypothetical protein TTHERM_00361680 [Tetrahymena thermophila SB210]